MADAITIKALQDASLDAKSLEEVVNGDDTTTVTTRLNRTYPTLAKAIKEMFERGGLPATPFATKAEMEASELVDGDYAQVTDDTVNNGLYVKTAGAWVKSAYDPTHTSKLYTDSAVLELEKRSSTSYDALAKYGVIQSVGISARNGSEFGSDSYESSDYIPVKRGDKLVYTGIMRTATGIAKYNSSKGFLGMLWDVDVDGAVPSYGLQLTIDDEETAYIRGCNRHSDGMTFKMDILASTASEIIAIKDDITLLKTGGSALIGDADLLTPDKIVPETGISAREGDAYSSGNYEATDFIDVSKLSSFRFFGYSVEASGIAGYDENKLFVEPVYYPTNDGLIPEEGRVFELTNPSIKYIRACNRLPNGRVMKIIVPLSYTAQDIAEMDNKLSNIEDLTPTSSDITVNFVSGTRFTVSSKCPDGSYMTHEWRYVERERQKERAWNFSMSSHNGQNIVAGNFNTIHIMNDIDSTDGVDDSIFVGYTHGCEWMLYAQFFLDGVEFDPATATGELKGKEFKCHIVTDNYKPDRDLSIQEAIDVTGASSSDFVMPAQPEQVRSRRVSTVTIEGNNRIKRHHKLTILKDNVQFKCLYMAMQRTYNNLDNNVLYLNDKDGTRNLYHNQLNKVEPLAPSTVTLSDGVGYGDENCFATRFESSGTSNGYAYNIVTTQANVDSSKQNKNHIQMWTSVASSVKVYFIPVYTSDLSRKYAKYPPDVFNTGDVIESYSESEYNITKLG